MEVDVGASGENAREFGRKRSAREPSAPFQTEVNTPPTPVVNGVTAIDGGKMSLNGRPKKPHTTVAFSPGFRQAACSSGCARR